VEKGRCHCKVATKGGDHGPRQGSGKAGGRTRRPERCDFLIAVQILRLTVAHRARIIAEYLIERRNVVADQRPLVSFKGCSNFCNHIRNIDLQLVFSPCKMMQLSPQLENYPIDSNEGFGRGLGALAGRSALRHCALQVLRRPLSQVLSNQLASCGCETPLLKTIGNNGPRTSGRRLRPLIVLPAGAGP
jgi:hypothetical protein